MAETYEYRVWWDNGESRIVRDLHRHLEWGRGSGLHEVSVEIRKITDWSELDRAAFRRGQQS